MTSDRTRVAFLCFLPVFMPGCAGFDRGEKSSPVALDGDLRARSLTITDESGRDRIRLTAGDSGTAKIVFRNVHGRERFSLGLWRDSATMVMFSPGGLANLEVESLGSGASQIALSDPEGELRLVLMVGEDGTAEVRFTDEDGNVLKSIAVPKGRKQ